MYTHRFLSFFSHSPLPGFLFLLILVLALPFTVFFLQEQQTEQYAAGSFPHVVGTQIVDGNGKPLLLRGSQVMGLLNGYRQDVIQAYPKIVTVMAQDWHMNVIRLPTCNWYWNTEQAGYIAKMQTYVQQANQAGLYVIIDLHDDNNCNPPYPWPEPYHLPRPGMDTYWQTVATTFKDNPMVIFDVYNEPNIRARSQEQYTDADWKLWLNGGTVGTDTFIGMQHLVDVIRQTGAQQMLMVEGYTTAETFHNIGSNTVVDPLNNVVYEAHKYGIQDGSAQWDTDFGFMAAKYPVFVGEWALMGGDNAGNINCSGITSPAQADQTVSTFLSYMASHNMGWTAYSFDPEHLVVDYTSFTPSLFPPGWTCPSSGASVINHAGMGVDVKTYLTQGTSASSTPPLTSQPSVTSPPGGTVFQVTICPHGIGNCGDNVNPQSGGNSAPLHKQRTVILTFLDSTNQPVATAQGTVVYQQSAGNFQGTIALPTLSSGQYLVSEKMDAFLSKQLPGIISITKGQTITLPSASLTTGDINNDNQLDLLDYNILIGCFGSKQNTSSCTMPPTTQSAGADINDNGVVDGGDYNLFLRELSVQKGG